MISFLMVLEKNFRLREYRNILDSRVGFANIQVLLRENQVLSQFNLRYFWQLFFIDIKKIN